MSSKQAKTTWARLKAAAGSPRGFILVIIVGMLAVLVVLGLSFAEQGRVDLMGASNSRDIASTDGLSETGFQMALRILADDRNVQSANNPTWDATLGPGWTSRWGYNPNVDKGTAAGGTVTPSGAGVNTNGPGPSRDDPRNYTESWQTMLWNEEVKGNTRAYAYIFQFDPADVRTKQAMRHPPDDKTLLDTWQRQPLARVKKFRVNSGTSFGVIQISISPRDGGINLNDVFDPKTGEELPGWYENLPAPHGLGAGTFPLAKVNLAGPDRRTMEYVLGKPPEWYTRQPEDAPFTAAPSTNPNEFNMAQTYQPTALYPSGQAMVDNGVYNFRSYFTPLGRDLEYRSRWVQSWLTNCGQTKLTVFWNSDDRYPNRYNFEGARYPLWSATYGMSSRRDRGGMVDLNPWGSGMTAADSDTRRFYEAGRINAQPYLRQLQTTAAGRWDSTFKGFGFDLLNPKRGGINGAADNPWLFYMTNGGVMNTTNANDDGAAYIGAGAYGFVKPHSFQLHFIPAAAQGRFWTDLMANWYFGGAPGYTTLRYGYADYEYSSWVQLSSTYDSVAMGSNWMTPTCHVWGANGYGPQSNTNLHPNEVKRGYERHPGNMPAAKAAATYSYPMTRFDDDVALANVHWLHNEPRAMLRAFGIQENWGQWGVDDPDGRYYDAINVNVSSYQVIYGLLTPEKLPSMLNRTAVAPHLHWKARLLDGAYEGMHEFRRYDPNTLAPTSYWVRDALPTDALPAPVNLPARNPLVPHGYGAYFQSPLGAYDATKFKLFHPYPQSLYATPVVPPDNETIAEDAPHSLIINPPAPATAADSQYPFPAFNDTAGAPDTWAFAKFVSPIPYKWSIHRAYFDRTSSSFTPLANPALIADANRGLLGKMDYITPEPLEYRFLTDADLPIVANSRGSNEVIRRGTGLPQDDVFLDTHYDLRLAPYHNISGDCLQSSLSPRPQKIWNWSDWFMQRTVRIDNNIHGINGGLFKPSNGANVFSLGFPEGVDGDQLVLTSNLKAFSGAVSVRQPRPHPLYGIPNPDYLQLYPGSSTSYNWSQQFRRYFPLVSNKPDPTEPGLTIKPLSAMQVYPPPTAPWEGLKMVDWYDGDLAKTHGQEGVDRMLHPSNPVPKVTEQNSVDPFVPAISRDDAWRITRIGRKYQEIVADELMDYMMNPWWPNPCAHMGAGGEIAVPLDRAPQPSFARSQLNAGAGGNYSRVGPITAAASYPLNPLPATWPSYLEAQASGAAALDYEIPDYLAYWNRFWMRASCRYNRTLANAGGMSYSDRNPSGSVAMYPQALQYYGHPLFDGADYVRTRWADKILDFPFNTLEDQVGSEWRYISGAVNLMYEVNSLSPSWAAPARNHPFRNWGDFVGFLGHLVYRTPMAVEPGGSRHPVQGVKAWTVCHGAQGHAKNKPAFFDGSRVSSSDAGPALADSLKGCNVVGYEKCTVARDGFWPISGNYGEYPTASGTPSTYPDRPGVFSSDAEWKRRIDEWRGRDAMGLRIEQHYISERAANDVLVNLSNGRIGPIDFDGDGHVTMTARDEIPDVDKYWPGYPYHSLAGNDSVVERKPPITEGSINTVDQNFGLRTTANNGWQAVARDQIIQGCVTLPVKFRSNTFRVTVVVELTDASYKNVYSVKRYARWYSRVPGTPAGAIKVHGPYTGEFIQHGKRSMGAVDPEMHWLGTTSPSP